MVVPDHVYKCVENWQASEVKIDAANDNPSFDFPSHLNNIL